MTQRTKEYIAANWAKLLLPFVLAWGAWVSLAAVSGSSLNDVEKVLHHRITATKQEIKSEYKEKLSDMEDRVFRLESKLMDKGEQK